MTARARAFDSEGKAIPIEAAPPDTLIAAHPSFPELGVVVAGQSQLIVGDYASTLVVDRGTEYRQVRIALPAEKSKLVEETAHLERWTDMAGQGWWSGDIHVHRSPRDLPTLLDSADLHFAPALTAWNNQVDKSANEPRLVYDGGGNRAYSTNNAEDERHWGAALFLSLKSPLRLFPRDAEYPPPYAIWQEVRLEGGFIDLEKLIWWEAPVISALIPPDTIGVAVNHFREDGISTRASLSRPRDETKYPGESGFARYILDLYVHYLNCGFRIPASAGSANGVAKNALGYNRSYVYLGSQFSYANWLAGQKAGRNFVTNGPMLVATFNGQMPGAVLANHVRSVQVKIEARSANDLDRAEILVDGAVAQILLPSQPLSRIKGSFTVAVKGGSWIAVRCFERNSTTVRLAHTSPAYVGTTPRRSRASLSYLRQWVQAEMNRIRAVPANKLTTEQKNEYLALCRKALRFYE